MGANLTGRAKLAGAGQGFKDCQHVVKRDFPGRLFPQGGVRLLDIQPDSVPHIVCAGAAALLHVSDVAAHERSETVALVGFVIVRRAPLGFQFRRPGAFLGFDGGFQASFAGLISSRQRPARLARFGKADRFAVIVEAWDCDPGLIRPRSAHLMLMLVKCR